MPNLDSQITEAENAEQAAQRQYAQFEAMFLLAQEELRRKRAHLAMLRQRREILTEIGRDDLCSRSAPIPQPPPQIFVDAQTGQSKLQCARCHTWTELRLTEHCDCVGVVCRPCAAIIRRADEELERQWCLLTHQKTIQPTEDRV